MPDLTYEATVQPEALPGRPNPRFPDEVSPNTYGEQVGQGIENAGAVLQGVHDKVLQQARVNQHTDFLNQAQVISNTLTHDPNTGAFTKQGKDAFGLQQQYLPQFDDQINALVQSVPDPKARQAAALSGAQLRAQFSEQLDQHELQAHKEFGVNTAQASVKIAQQVGAANYNHPDILASNLDTVNVSLENLGQQLGWSPEQVQEAKQQQTSVFHGNVIDRILADNKIGMAQTYLDSVKDNMDANAAFDAQKRITSEMRETQNAAKQDIANRFQDSMAAAKYGLPGSIQVTRQEMDVLYPKDGGRRWDGLKTVAAAGAQSRQYDQMTPEAVQADVDAHKPVSGGPEAVYNIDGYEMRAQAAQRSLAARQADPAQFAIQSGAGWKAIDFSDSAAALMQLRSRANTQEQVSEQTGTNTPLLSKQETRQFSSLLASQAPDRQLQTLVAIRATMPNDPSYGALMKQVHPEDPLTAIAGAMLDRPSVDNQPSWYNPRMATDSTAAAQRILEGKAILTEKDEKGILSKFPMPPDTDESKSPGLQNPFIQAIGGVNSDLFRGRDKTVESAYAAYKADYAALASKMGVSSGILNVQLAQRAAADVIGTTTNYGSSTVAVPRGMDPTRFAGIMDSASTAALKAAGYDDKDVAALAGHGVRELGDMLGTGRYTLVNGNGDPIGSKNGRRPIIVDLNQYRVPQAPAQVFPRVTYSDIAADGQ